MTRSTSSSTTIAFIAGGLVLTLLVLVGAYVAVGLTDDSGSGSSGTVPAATQETAPKGLERFYSQTVDWDDCGGLKCGTIEVPVDYDQPEGDTLSLRLEVQPASSDSKDLIFINPGGPGGSGVDFVGTMVGGFSSDVLDNYGVVGMDPRGVGQSTPVECFDDARFDDFVASDPTPDDAQERAAFEQDFAEFGRACSENTPDNVAAHVSTDEAVRDFDVARAVLGQQKMNFFGASYGTTVGSTYATLFPDKVGRMVLDGATDPSLDPLASALGQAQGFELALSNYLTDCVDGGDCPLGSTVDQARDRLKQLVDSLDSSPLPTGTDRELTEGRAFYGIAVTLYARQTWSALTQGLEAALKGDGSPLLRFSDVYFERQPDGTYNGNIGEVITVVTCLDAAKRPGPADAERYLPTFEQVSPIFGEALAYGGATCADWPVPATHPQPAIDAEGAPPILVLGTTGDPATPYEYAPKMAKALGDDVGVLVTRVGDGHTAFLSGNDCIADIVNGYFVDGSVPKNGVRCD